MKLARLAGFLGVAIFAVCLVMASAASATFPKFNPTAKQNFKVLSGAGILAISTGESIECATDLGTGEITGADTVAKVAVTFHGCVGKSGTSTCKVHSENEPEGLVRVNTLKGELGEVAKAEATTEAGEYLVPETGAVFVTPLGSCIVKAAIEGSIAGEVTPTKKLALTGGVNFVGSLGAQSIKKITTLSGEKKPKLTAFGLFAASENTNETTDYEKDVEVT